MVWTLTQCLEQLKLDYPNNWQNYCFGKVCKHEHQFHESGRGVRQKGSESCVVCRQLRDQTERSRQKRQKRYQDNRDLVAQQSRAYALENPEKLTTIKRNYRARKYNSVHDSGGYKAALYTIFDKSCAYCGKALNFEEVHLDHVLALANKGSTVFRNFIPTCQSCNTSKQDSCLLIWYSRQSFFNCDRLQKIVDHCAKK